MAVMCVAVQAINCYGYSGERMQVRIPVSYNVRGGDGTGEFVLKPVGNAPMPYESDDVQSIEVKAGETGEFGPIQYDTPGEYNYEIIRKDSDDENIEEDNHTYRVRVVALSDGSVSKAIMKSGQEGKTTEVSYNDIYREPSKPRKSSAAPDTGDVSRLLTYSVIGVVCLMIIIGFRCIRRRARKDGERL